jgi:1-aminocyclopropane-1-carboxylate deaminase/D-cysteine desulfhydrase-like pyridoxal-dependent ACC family enzyme
MVLAGAAAGHFAPETVVVACGAAGTVAALIVTAGSARRYFFRHPLCVIRP